MLLQTNSYIVPKDRRSEHTRLLRKFRQTLTRLGCENFEVYEQVGAQWAAGEATGRFVQIMRFRDRAQQLEVQEAEKRDPIAQQLIQEFCALINFPYQQQQGLFAVGFYTSALPVAPARAQASPRPSAQTAAVSGVVPPQGQAEEPVAELSEALELPPALEEGAAEGASLLDFDGIDAAEDAPPLRLASESDESDEIIEADLPLEEPESVQDPSNGKHTRSFADDDRRR
jgi:hypothetical protein